MKYLLFLFLRSGNEAKRLISVTQHAMPEEFGEKENGSVLTLGFQVPSACSAGYGYSIGVQLLRFLQTSIL